MTIKKDDGPAIVTFECPRCSRNTVLQSDGADSLLVNTTGPPWPVMLVSPLFADASPDATVIFHEPVAFTVSVPVDEPSIASIRWRPE